MRTTVVVTHELALDALCMALVEDNHMVEAFSPERANDSLAVRIRLRRSRRREKTSGTAALQFPSELGAIDGVAVTDEEPRKSSPNIAKDHAAWTSTRHSLVRTEYLRRTPNIWNVVDGICVNRRRRTSPARWLRGCVGQRRRPWRRHDTDRVRSCRRPAPQRVPRRSRLQGNRAID